MVEHVLQEQELPIAGAGQTGAKATAEAQLVLGADRLLVDAPVLAVGRVGDLVVKVFARVLVAVTALNASLFGLLWLPMAASALVGLGYAAYLYLSERTDEEGAVEFSNPFELGPAVKFGLLYAVVLVVARAAQVYLGDTGVYVSSLVAGTADADAIALSMAQLSLGDGGLELSTAARGIVLASMSNTLTKGGVVLATGSASLRRALLPGLVLMPVVGIVVAFVM